MSAPTSPFAAYLYLLLNGWQDPADGLRGFLTDDAANDYATGKLVTGLAKPGEAAFQALQPVNGFPAMLEADASPDEFLDYNAAIRGIDTRGADEATVRSWFATGGPSRLRGGDEAIRIRVEAVLTGSKSIRFYPRTNPSAPGVDSPGHTLIRTKTSETPGGTASVIAAAYDRAAPVWQIVHAQTMTGAAIDELSGPISGLSGDIEDQ